MATVYLVSGANRGIGLGLVQSLCSRENTVVFAGARDPDSAGPLHALAAQHPGRIHVVKLVSGDQDGNAAAVSEIQQKAGRLDVVIANAGIAKWYGPAPECPLEELRDHFEVNVVGPYALFKACFALLKASTPSPKFVVISSGAGSIEFGGQMQLQMTPYGISKAGVNYFARKLHFECEKDGLIVFPLNPGPVSTDLSSGGSGAGMAALQFKTIDDTALMLLALIDGATRENSGGQFVNFDGGRRPW